MLGNLEAWVAYWQIRLRLRDWKLSVSIAEASVVDDAGVKHIVTGTNQWDAAEMTATIIIDPKAGNETLCHEMLHLVLEGHDNNKGTDINVERAIERLTDALFLIPPVLPPAVSSCPLPSPPYLQPSRK